MNIHINTKVEFGHKYGPYTVTNYTTAREKSNRCVIWEVTCKCGYVRYINGNNLRFNHFGACPKCGRRE